MKNNTRLHYVHNPRQYICNRFKYEAPALNTKHPIYSAMLSVMGAIRIRMIREWIYW